MTHRMVPRLTWIILAALAVLALTACSQLPPAWPGLTPGDKVVYLTGASKVYAIHAADGAKKWEYEHKLPPSGLGGLFGGSTSDPMHAAPAVGNDLVYFGSDSGYLLALDATTGALKCSFQPEPPVTLFGIREKPLPIYAGIALSGERVIFAGTADKIYAVDATTCKPDWEFQVGSRVWGTPLVVSDTLYVSTLGRTLIALNAETGKPRWTFDQAKGALAGSPTFDGGMVYVGSFDNHLYALDAASGAVRWTFDAKSWVWDGPAVVSNTLYFGDMSGNLYAMDATTQQPVWSQPFQAGGAIRATPLYADGVLYFGTDSGTLYALDATTGRERWPQPFKVPNARFLTTPVLREGLLLVAPQGTPTLLYGLNPANGQTQWQFKP